MNGVLSSVLNIMLNSILSNVPEQYAEWYTFEPSPHTRHSGEGERKRAACFVHSTAVLPVRPNGYFM